MEASIVDLRYNMKEVLEALERREKVIITYHGKPRGILLPLPEKSTGGKVTEHPFFGIAKEDKKPVKEIMDELRTGRNHGV